LAASSTTTASTHATSEPTTKTAATGTAFVTASTSCRWASESGFCLAILVRS
jgi:hypothetical protein